MWRWLKVVPRIEIDDGAFVRQVSIDELLRAKQPGTATVVSMAAVSIDPHPLSTVSTVAVESAYYARQTFESHPLIIDRLQGQYWFPEYGYVISPAAKVWHHATLGTYADEKFEAILAVLRSSRAFPLVRERCLEQHLQSVRQVRGLRIITSHYASHNFGHFMLDMVPLIKFAHEKNLNILTRKRLPWQREIYDLLGVDERTVEEVSESAVLLEDVLVSNRHNAIATNAAHPHLRTVFDDVAQRLPKGKGPKRFYLSREGSGSRRMRNRNELIRELVNIGFDVLQPQLLSIADQAAAFAGAHLIVSEFGAVMANVVYCEPGTTVVELIPEGQCDPWSVRLCAALRLGHVQLFQMVAPHDRRVIRIGGKDYDNIDFSFDVDVRSVVETVKKIIAEKDLR